MRPRAASATRSSASATAKRGTAPSTVALWVLVAGASLTLALHVGSAGLREPTLGFTAYYTAAWLVANDDEPPQLYDHRWFLDQTPRAGIREPRDIFNINPPPAALLFLPLVILEPRDAKLAWSLLNVGFLAGSLLVLRRTLRVAFPRATANRFWFPALCGLALVSRPIQENLRLGQAYGLMLLLAIVALDGFVRAYPGRAGAALGAMAATKTSGVLLWVALLMERRPRPLLWGGLTAVAVAVASLPFIGSAAWWEYPQWLPSLFGQRWTGLTVYQTLPSLIHHLTTYDASASPEPPLRAAWLAMPLATLLSALALAAMLFALWPLARGLPLPALRAMRFGALLALSVPLQPLGEDYHYALLLPAGAIALLAAVELPSGRRPAIAAVLASTGALLVVAPLPYTSSSLATGWWALLAYPRVYGALLLAGVIARIAMRERMEWTSALRQRGFQVSRR